MYKQLFSFHSVIRIRLFLKFFTIMTKTTVMPYTVVYFSLQIGVKLTTILIIIIGVISILGYLVGGKLTDSHGRKKIIMSSEFITGIGFVGVGVFDSFDYMYMVPILIAFCVIYFFESMSNPAYSALIIDVSNESNRKVIYTYFMWISSIGFAIGSLIGGFYFEQFSNVLFIIVGITSFISCVCTYTLIHEDKVNKEVDSSTNSYLEQPEKKQRKNLKAALSSLFFFLCAGQFVLHLLKEQFPNYITIRIVDSFPEDEFNFTGYNMIGFLNVEETIVIMFLAGIVLKVTLIFSDRTNINVGILLMVTGFVTLSFFIHPVALIMGMLLIAIGGLVYMPTIQSIVANSIPEKTRGYHLSILGLLGAVGGIVASVFIAATDYVSAMTITYAYVILGIILLLFYNRAVSMFNNKKLGTYKGDRSEMVS